MSELNVPQKSNGEFHSPETSLVPIAVPPLDALSIQRAPEIVFQEAQRAAKAIAQVIEAKPKKLQFNRENLPAIRGLADARTLLRGHGGRAFHQIC